MPVDTPTVDQVRPALAGARWYAGEAIREVRLVDDLGEVAHVLAVVDDEVAYQVFLGPDGCDVPTHPAVVAALVGEPRPAKLLGVEQSNTSVIAGAELVKVYRRVLSGPNPEAEVVAALDGLGFPHVVGPVQVRRAGGLDLALVTPFLAGAADAWSIALDAEDLRPAAAELGAVVAAMHLALAEAFGTTPARPEDHRDTLVAACAAVGADPPEAALDALGAAEPGRLVRVHGDLHLGQVLRAGDSWFVIDFEGEPVRPLAERTAPDSPLRDVAGMLRSFDYAGALGGHHPTWVAAASDAFLGGYLATPGIADLLPSPVEDVLSAHVLAKAAYELAYERAHRPSWAWVPEAAIEQLTSGARGVA